MKVDHMWMSESSFTDFRYHSIIKLAPILIEWLSISSIIYRDACCDDAGTNSLVLFDLW